MRQLVRISASAPDPVRLAEDCLEWFAPAQQGCMHSACMADMHTLCANEFTGLWQDCMQAFEHSPQARYRFVLN